MNLFEDLSRFNLARYVDHATKVIYFSIKLIKKIAVTRNYKENKVDSIRQLSHARVLLPVGGGGGGGWGGVGGIWNPRETPL